MTLSTLFSKSNTSKLPSQNLGHWDSDETTEDTSNSHSRTSTVATPPGLEGMNGDEMFHNDDTVKRRTGRGSALVVERVEAAPDARQAERQELAVQQTGRAFRKIPPPPPLSEMIAYEADSLGSPEEKKLASTPPLYPPPYRVPNTFGDSSQSNVDLLEFSGLMMQDDTHSYAHDTQDEMADLLTASPPTSMYQTRNVSYGGVSQPLNIPRHATNVLTDVPQSSVASSQQSIEAQTPPASSLSPTGNTSGQQTVWYSAVGSVDVSSDSYKKLLWKSRDFLGPGAAPAALPVTTQSTFVSRRAKAKARIPVSSQATTERSSNVGTVRKPQSPKIEPPGTRTVAPKKKLSLTSKPKAILLKDGDNTRKKGKKRVSIQKTVEAFVPSCHTYTPRLKKNFEYRPAEARTSVQTMSSTMGTLARPNFRDALRRVSMILREHIVKIEHRFESPEHRRHVLFDPSMKDAFFEDDFLIPRYKCTMVRVPMARPSMVYAMRKINTKYAIPSEEEIYDFAHQLFKSVQLSSECSIVCLIYVERLMEIAKVPLLACTWRPIFMCGLLLASKVWQDLASWNIEFSSVYPQYSLDAINRLELQFLRMVKWDLYISSSLYAKYYFALRSLVSKKDFRQKYNRMVGGVGSVAASEAKKVQERTELLKVEAINQLSRSM